MRRKFLVKFTMSLLGLVLFSSSPLKAQDFLWVWQTPENFRSLTQENSGNVQHEVFVSETGDERIELTHFRNALNWEQLLQSLRLSEQSARCRILEEHNPEAHRLKTGAFKGREIRMFYECPLFQRSGILELFEVSPTHMIQLHRESQKARLSETQKNQWVGWLETHTGLCQKGRESLCEREQELASRARQNPFQNFQVKDSIWLSSGKRNWAQNSETFERSACQRANPDFLKVLKTSAQQPREDRSCFQSQRQGQWRFHCLPTNLEGIEIEYVLSHTRELCAADAKNPVFVSQHE